MGMRTVTVRAAGLLRPPTLKRGINLQANEGVGSERGRELALIAPPKIEQLALACHALTF